jgi:uncharacterized protein (DUF2147 family)
MKATALVLLLMTAVSGAWAQATPVGLWKTIDDETKLERSLVRITDNGGVLSGKIEKLSDPTRAAAKCDKCEGARKDQAIVGMVIIEGVKKRADEAYWDAGTIFDPESGKTYKVRLTPKDGGKLLEMRGFIGFFYRNQTWVRAE